MLGPARGSRLHDTARERGNDDSPRRLFLRSTAVSFARRADVHPCLPLSSLSAVDRFGLYPAQHDRRRFIRRDGRRLGEFVGPSGSGRRHIVKRCPSCGDPIVSYFGKSEKLAVVKTGTLDDPSALPPEAHIFVDSKLPWLTLDDGMPQFTGIYDFEATWPAASYRRLMTVRAKP